MEATVPSRKVAELDEGQKAAARLQVGIQAVLAFASPGQGISHDPMAELPSQ